MTSELTQAALEPCPWCGTVEHLSFQWPGSMTADMPDSRCRVVCTHIDHGTAVGVVGPTAYGKFAAATAWNTRLTAQSGEGDYTEAFDILVDVHDALALTAEYSDGARVSSFVASSTQFARLRKFLHDRQYADPRSSGEGRSGAGEDAGPFHVSQSGDGKKLWFSARDPASGVTIPARDRTDARNLVSSLNHACATFAALNARQSGEGERDDELARVVHANGPVVVDWMGEGIAWRPLDYGTWTPFDALRATSAAKAPDTGEGE